MKRLTITYDGITLFDAEVASLSWQEGDGTVSVSARDKGAPAKQGLADVLASLGQKRNGGGKALEVHDAQ